MGELLVLAKELLRNKSAEPSSSGQNEPIIAAATMHDRVVAYICKAKAMPPGPVVLVDHVFHQPFAERRGKGRKRSDVEAVAKPRNSLTAFRCRLIIM